MKQRNGWGIVLWVYLMAMAGLAEAQNAGAMRKQVEASMLVTGLVLIERDGSVSKLEVDQRDKLPESVAGLIEGSGSAWRFEPVRVEGVARRVQARMSLRVVANRLDDGTYRIGIRSGHFGEEAMTPEERVQQPDAIKGVSMRPPIYPMSALEMNARGTVYLVLKLGLDGSVQDAVAEQVNLRTVGNIKQMDRMRSILSTSALNAAKKWTFSMPASDEMRKVGFASVRVPVDYEFGGVVKPAYGEWHSYIPGPRQSAPWTGQDLGATESPDAMLAGVLYEAGKSLRLLTPLSREG